MISLNNIKPFLLTENISDSEIASCLKEISQVFTQKRHKIGDLYAKEKYVSSYAVFYMLTNIHKVNFLFDQMSDLQKESISKTTIIEIGTGPGTYIFGLLNLLQNKDIKYVGVDHSELMLKQAQAIGDGLYSDYNIQWRKDIPKVNGPVTYIFGNSLNEIGVSKANELISQNEIENIICIEPGTKESFSIVAKFRDSVVRKGFNVSYPCSSNFACPIVAREDDWCHQIVKVKLESDILRIGQMAKLDRLSMPAVIHYYTREESSQSKKARIIRLYKNLKYAFIWEVCSTLNGELKAFKIEVPKKLLKKKDIKRLQIMSSGYEVDYEIDRVIDDELVRVKNVSVNII